MIFLQSNSYNLEIAKIFGINSSIFLTCLDMEYCYQKRNNKILDNDAINLSRSEIYERTALDDSQQVDIEFSLTECGVLTTKPVQNSSSKNYYIVNFAQIDKILKSSNPSDVISSEKANQFIRGKRKEPLSKRQTYINKLKTKIKVEDPIIQQYFVDWIDAVYTNPKGFLSDHSVLIAQQELMEYAKDSQDIQIKVLKEAIKGGYRDMTWAIKNYEENNNISSRNFVSYLDNRVDPNNISDEVF